MGLDDSHNVAQLPFSFSSEILVTPPESGVSYTRTALTRMGHLYSSYSEIVITFCKKSSVFLYTSISLCFTVITLN